MPSELATDPPGILHLIVGAGSLPNEWWYAQHTPRGMWFS